MDAELRATLAALGHVVHDEADCVKRVRRLGVEEVDESDDDDYLRPDVEWVAATLAGEGDADAQRRRAAQRDRAAAGVEIGVDDAPVDLSRPLESRADAASFFVNDVRTDRRAARSIETRETMPRTLWGTPLRRVIISSFMDPVSNGQFFRDWFLHWDTDDRIPIVVLAHLTKEAFSSVVAADGSTRPVGSFEEDAKARFVRDASEERFSVPRRRVEGGDARTAFFDLIEGKCDDDDAVPWALANATVCLPRLPNPKETHHYEGCQHVKLFVAEYGAGVRVCVSSANLCEGEQVSQLEVWFVHDFRFAEERSLRSLVLDDDATRLAAAAGDGGRRPLTFGANLVDFLARMTEGLGDEVCVDGDTLGNWRSRLLACDTASCDGVQLVPTAPGVNYYAPHKPRRDDDAFLGFARFELCDVEGGEAAFDASPKRLTRSKKAECVHLKDATFEDGETFRDGSVVAPGGFRGFFPKPLAAAIRSLRAAGTHVRVELACVFSGARLLPKAGEQGDAAVDDRKPAHETWRASFHVAVDAWGPTTDASTSAFAVLLSSLRTPQGYQALRVALDGEGVDWWAHAAANRELAFFAWSPEWSRGGATAICDDIAWAAGTSPTRVEAALADQNVARARRTGAVVDVEGPKCWNPTRRPATLTRDDLLSKQNQAKLVAHDLAYDRAPPPGEEAARRQGGDLVEAHAKFIYRLFLDEASGETFGWVYVGSHNFSAAAWGAGPRWGYCRTTNWELGVVLQQPPGRPAPAGVPPFHRRYPLPYVPGAPADPDTLLNKEQFKDRRHTARDADDAALQRVIANSLGVDGGDAEPAFAPEPDRDDAALRRAMAMSLEAPRPAGGDDDFARALAESARDAAAARARDDEQLARALELSRQERPAADADVARAIALSSPGAREAEPIDLT